MSCTSQESPSTLPHPIAQHGSLSACTCRTHSLRGLHRTSGCFQTPFVKAGGNEENLPESGPALLISVLRSARNGERGREATTCSKATALLPTALCCAPLCLQTHSPHLQAADDLPQRKSRLISSDEGGCGQMEDLVEVGLIQPVKSCRVVVVGRAEAEKEGMGPGGGGVGRRWGREERREEGRGTKAAQNPK